MSDKSTPPSRSSRRRPPSDEGQGNAWPSSNNWKKSSTKARQAPPRQRTGEPSQPLARSNSQMTSSETRQRPRPSTDEPAVPSEARKVAFNELHTSFFDDFSPPHPSSHEEPVLDLGGNEFIGTEEISDYPVLDPTADKRRTQHIAEQRKKRKEKEATAREAADSQREKTRDEGGRRRSKPLDEGERRERGQRPRSSEDARRSVSSNEREARRPTPRSTDDTRKAVRASEREARKRREAPRSGALSPQERPTSRENLVPASALLALQKKLQALEAQLARLQVGGVDPQAQGGPADPEKNLLSDDWGRKPSDDEAKAGRRNRIDFFLRLMIDKGASDFHLHVGNSPIYRQSGNMSPMRYRPMRQRDWERLIRPITPPPLWESYERGGDVDFAYEIAGVARFRVNLLKQYRGGGAVFRLIPSNIMNLEQLGLPHQIARFAEMDNGLVLVTGPTGSGKSTTLAALIDLINRRKADHLITIEDPIEFVHPMHRCLLHQREVGTHTVEFNEALTAAIREDPDLILVGEMRDRETMLLALQAAEKGMLVFGTLHTNSAAKTVDRIINAFPVEEQDQVRTVLASTLQGVVSQQLLRRIGGGRVAALEILFSSRAMANLIREGKTHHLPSIMQTGKKRGMIQMDDSLMTLVKTGVISREAALEKALEKEPFKDESLDDYADQGER